MKLRPAKPVDLATAAALALLAYAGANLVHEIAGHCGVAFVAGGGCSFVSTADIRLRPETPPDRFTFIAMAGTFANFAAAAIAYVALRRSRRGAGALILLLWLTMAVNLFVASGYMAFSPLISFGDWHSLLVMAGASWMWRPLIAACGAVAWWLSWRICRQELRVLLAPSPEPRRIAASLLWTAYAAGAAAMTAAALLGPLPLRWALLVGLGSTAGLTAPLLILPFTLQREGRDGRHDFALDRNPLWLVAGGAGAVALMVLGRGFPV
jgi:hypothetical protein